MAHHRIIIETSPAADVGFKAEIAEGFGKGRFWRSINGDREDAYKFLRREMEMEFPKHTFDFIHVHAQETT